MSEPDRTYYVTEDDGRCWWRCGQWTLPEARHEAAQWARESIGNWARSRFVGRVMTRLSEHEPGCGIEMHPAEGDCSAEREAWEFDLRAMTRLAILLVVAAQLADLALTGLALRRDPTGEANPAMVALFGLGGFGAVALAKVVALVAVLAIMARLRSRRLALFAATAGVVGAATGLVTLAHA